MSKFTILSLLFIASSYCAQIPFKSGQEMVKFMFDQVDKTVIIDQSSPEQVSNVFKLKNSNTNDMLHINHRPTGKNYYLDYGFNFGSNQLQNMQVDAFYDEGFENIAVVEAQEILKSVHTRLGEPTYSSTDYFTWDKEKYIVEVGTYENGWGVYIYSYSYNFADSDLNCEGKAGDFYTLKDDLLFLFFEQLKIHDGYTRKTNADILALIGSEEYFSREYEGIFVEGSFTYENGEVMSIMFDYFYDCPATLIHLDADANDIKSLVMSNTSVSATVTQTEGIMNYQWKFKQFELNFSQFHDGYSFYVTRLSN
jgi:hypothetical protein